MSRKARIADSGPSAYQRLKALPAEERQWLWERREALTAKQIIAEVAGRYRIAGLTEQRLSDFWRWQDGQMALVQLNEDAALFREEFSRSGTPATPEDIHIKTVDYMRLKGIREEDDKLLAYAVTEARKAIELEHGARKLAILEAKAAEAVKTAEDPKLSAADKAARIREIFKR
jgi:hypothetical protein